jgi:hypothetical protein
LLAFGLGIVGLVGVAFRLEIFGGEGCIEVMVLTVNAFAFGLLEHVDLVDHCKKHILDVAARAGRRLEVPHLVFLQHLPQLLSVVVTE